MEDSTLMKLGTDEIRKDVDTLLKTASDGHVIKLANLVRNLSVQLDEVFKHCRKLEQRLKK